MDLQKLSPAARKLMLATLDNADTQETEEFCRITEGLFEVVVCTSLPDEEATTRMNLVPSGTARGWVLCGHPDHVQPCDTDPTTHRHIVFEC